MKWIDFRLLPAVVALSAFAMLASATEPRLKVLTFDPPGAGKDASQGTGCFGCTFAINDWGAVAGTYLDASNVYHGFIRSSSGRYITFQSPGADTTPGDYNGTFAQSINDVGETAGYFYDASGTAHGFVRSPLGRISTFDVPGAAYGTFPVFLNLVGKVAGYYLDADLLFRAFLRNSDGTFETFVGPASCTSGTPTGCYGSAATFVDLFGNSVGAFEDNSGNFVGHVLLRGAGGKLGRYDAPGAGTGLYQGTGCPGCNIGLNHWGALAGTFTDANNVIHGFLRHLDGRTTVFNAEGAGTTSYEGTGCFSDCPVSINDAGTITGSYVDANDVQHGYLREPSGTFVTIDPTGSIGSQPESINESGTVVGYYIDANNVFHGFLAIGQGFAR